jgi:hypothetical protein
VTAMPGSDMLLLAACAAHCSVPWNWRARQDSNLRPPA